jgi:hypothetical protein
VRGDLRTSKSAISASPPNRFAFFGERAGALNRVGAGIDGFVQAFGFDKPFSHPRSIVASMLALAALTDNGAPALIVRARFIALARTASGVSSI